MRKCGVLLLGALLAACVGRLDHPVSPSDPPAAPSAPEPAPLEGPAAFQQLFQGFRDAEVAIAWLKAHPSPPGTSPRLVTFPLFERAILRAYARRGPFGPVRNAMVFGYSAWSRLPPRKMADLMLDPETERALLAADSFRLVGTEIELPGLSRKCYRLEMLRRGAGPFRFDFRLSSTTERWDLPDGTVLLRSEPSPMPPPQGMTLYRDATSIEPSGTGSQVTEFVVAGTDLTVPFFFAGTMRASSLKTFQDRVTNLWIRTTW